MTVHDSALALADRAAPAVGPAPEAKLYRLSLERQRKRVKQLLDGARSIASARAALPEAISAADEFPGDLPTRSYILQLREKAGESQGVSEAWEQLFREAPHDRTVLSFHMRRLVRDKRQDRALELLDQALPAPGRTFEDALARAELLDTIQAFEASDEAFRALLDQHDRRAARVSWAKRLAKRGLYEDAGVVLEAAKQPIPAGGKAAALLTEIEAARALFHQYERAEDLRGANFRILAMKHAILSFRDRPVEHGDEPLRLVLVTGSLGAGGAERQLSRLAAAIRQRSTDPANGIERVDVLVKEHDPARGGDFFLPGLSEAGVAVRQANELPPIPVRKQLELAPDLARMAEMLPPQVHYGAVRIAPWLREIKPHVVSLWQDGTCLFGALAALLAGVPRIQLVFRGLPPNIRADRHKPEYDVLFRALAQVPGVEFMSNSRTAALEYAKWLDLPGERFTVLPNAVPVPSQEGTDDDIRKWQAFAARTADASETIGGVFRFEPDKRPLVWLRMAARYLHLRPEARFVIVGSGRLMDEGRALAEKLGITERLLFAGSSSAVGYWYEKMDVKVLLSRFEGLPNVLIEAQQLGTPVVSTPAGGALECFAEGVSGHLLDCAANPCLDQACERIAALVGRRRHAPGEIEAAARDTARRFDVDTVIAHFLSLCTAPASVPA